jgi:multidrug efflux pump subunit AcrA (membrane-fusion protein)
MDIGVIIVIVVVALILLALFFFVGRKGRERKLETRRHEAREIGREAELHRADADRTRAEADAQSAEARRQEALARERSAEAEEKHRQARDRHIEAASHHPDMDEKEAAAEFDRRHTEGQGVENGEGAVRHHEQTETPAEERERHFERNEQGEVVRDEQYQEPRR